MRKLIARKEMQPERLCPIFKPKLSTLICVHVWIRAVHLQDD